LAQGSNFGVGLPAAIDTGNIVEENTILGNTNGIFLGPGVKGNFFRGNLVIGNPPVQVSLDNASSSGVDVKNLADPGANAFEGNVCATSINAPCPSVGPSLTASPNPIPVTGNTLVGQTTISWNAPDAQVIEIHIGTPNGPVLTTQGNRGSIQTGAWVSDGLTFYLQDVTGGNPLTSDYTVATLVVHLQRPGQVSLLNRRSLWAAGASAIPLLGLVLCGFFWRRRS
jgi:parallel beta-helix repeat protein